MLTAGLLWCHQLLLDGERTVEGDLPSGTEEPLFTLLSVNPTTCQVHNRRHQFFRTSLCSSLPISGECQQPVSPKLLLLPLFIEDKYR